MESNLIAEVSKLQQRQAELAARPSDAKKKKQKKQKERDEGSSRTSPSVKKRESGKAERDAGKAKFLAARQQRPTASFAPKARKYKDPLNKRLKDVIACLLETRKDLSKDKICKKKEIDPDDSELWMAVLNNPRIQVLEEAGKFRYRPRHHHIADKETLLMHIRRNAQGTPWNEISDTYVEVAADLEALLNERKIFSIENPDIEDRVLFWNDPTADGLILSEQILELWRDTQLPTEVRTYEEVFQRSAIPPAARKPSRKREPMQKAPRERKPRDFKYRKITNVHMPELFKSHQPEQID